MPTGVWQGRDKQIRKAMVYDSTWEIKRAWIRMPMKMGKWTIFRNFRNRSQQSVGSLYRIDVRGMWLLSMRQRQAPREPRITGVLRQGRLPSLTAGYVHTLKGHLGKAVWTFWVKIPNRESDIVGPCHPSPNPQLLQRSRQGILPVLQREFDTTFGKLARVYLKSQHGQNDADQLWNTFQAHTRP